MGYSDETLDASSITDSVVDVLYDNGHTYSLGLRVAMSLFGIIGLFAIYDGGWGYFIGPPIILIAIYTHTARTGTDVSFENNYIREFSKSFWVKKGKWVPTSLLPDITILRMGKSVGVNHVYSEKTAHVSKTIYSICILSATHRERILISETESSKKAYEVAVFLSKKMDKNLTDFKPFISKATMARRYERH